MCAFRKSAIRRHAVTVSRSLRRLRAAAGLPSTLRGFLVCWQENVPSARGRSRGILASAPAGGGPMSGPGKTPAERAAADPSTESEAPGLLGTVSAIAKPIAKRAQTAVANRAGHAHAHAHTGGRCSPSVGGVGLGAVVARPTTAYQAADLGDVAALVDLVSEREAEGVERPAILNATETTGLSPWLVAAWRGHTTALQWMLQQGTSTEAVSDNAMGATAAHLAVCGGHFETLHFLLEHGACVDARDKQQCTPLIVASQYGEIMCAHLLLRHGADAQAVDENGDTALHWVAYKGHYEFVRLLANGTATPPWSDRIQERQPLLGEARNADGSFNIDLADNQGQTPLHLAASRGSVRVVLRLCDIGASLSVEDNSGRTPVEATKEKLSTKDTRLRCVISQCSQARVPRA